MQLIELHKQVVQLKRNQGTVKCACGYHAWENFRRVKFAHKLLNFPNHEITEDLPADLVIICQIFSRQNSLLPKIF